MSNEAPSENEILARMMGETLTRLANALREVRELRAENERLRAAAPKAKRARR